MNEFLKKLGVPVVSAVLGGALVLVGLKLQPNLSQNSAGASESEANQIHPLSADRDEILKKQSERQSQFRNIFNDRFFGPRDPFAEMQKMSQQMEKRMKEFNEDHNFEKNPFDFWYSQQLNGGSIEDIAKRQDDNFVYYEIKVGDFNLTSLNTKVEQGQIRVTGSVEKRDEPGESGNIQSYFKSSFARTFPLPEGVDANKMETISEKDKIILKFPKLKT